MTGEAFRAAAQADPHGFPTAYGPPTSGIKTKEINMIAKYLTVGAFLDSMEHTQYRFVENARKGTVPRVYLPCGTRDGMYRKVLARKELAEQEKVDANCYAERGLQRRPPRPDAFAGRPVPVCLQHDGRVHFHLHRGGGRQPDLPEQ